MRCPGLRAGGAGVLACLLLAPALAAAQVLELTFDDGPDGSGPADGRADLANNQEAFPVGSPWFTARLAGAAHRSAVGEGRYGRAAVLAGGSDAIEIAGPLGGTTLYFLMWIRTSGASSGWVGLVEHSLGLRLEDGALSVQVWDPAAGAYVVRNLGLTLPRDGAFHHLGVLVDLASRSVGALVDFTAAATVDHLPPVPPATAPLRVGLGLVGAVDELTLFQDRYPDRFDFDPEDCGDPAGTLACREEVFTTTPRGWAWPVPVRVKTVYDPARCTPASRCRLLFLLSGGGKCNDNYEQAETVVAFARAGYAAATVDPYCENTTAFAQWPHETSQIVQARAFLRDRSALSGILAADPYEAVGTSHGAGLVAYLALREAEFPARTFAMSANASPHCAYHAVLCEDMRNYVDAYWVPFPHDDSDPRIAALHAAVELPDVLTTDIVRSREFGASWGVDLSPESPVCAPDGTHRCYEEGLGFTYGGRRLRDAWRALEDPAAPTGYFFEVQSSDCRHGLGSSAEWDCVRCFLDHGRLGMGTACPACLTLPEGGPSQSCPVTFPAADADADADPDARADGEADAGTDAEPDAGSDGDRGDRGVVEDDGGVSTDARADTAPPADGTAGCGCRAAGPSAVPRPARVVAAFLAAACAVRRSRRNTA